MWTYSQSTGVLTTADGTPLQPAGYAGNGLGKNNPAMQNVRDVGPLPQGFYTMAEMIEDDPITGPFSIVLVPDPTNDEFDRSGFRIHGDSLEHPGMASDGCIVQTRPNRLRVWTSQDHRLQVVT
jgi:Protein of unknown function (DUF2778)